MLNDFKNALRLACVVSILIFTGCGSKGPAHSDTFVVGGELLESNPTPTVAIMKSDGFKQFYTFCSGVLISPQKVLTAAHCFHSKIPMNEYRIALRSAKPDREPHESLYKVLNIHLYHGFAPKQMLRSRDGVFRPSHAGDLSIWEMDREALDVVPATLIEAPLVDSYFVDNQPFLVMGFGKKSSWESDFSAAQLARAKIPFFKISTQTVISVVLEEGRPIKRTTFITIPSQSENEFFLGGPGMADTCKGDSGGPVFIEKEDPPGLTLVGLTSRGTSACIGGGIYTLLKPKIPWIQSILH